MPANYILRRTPSTEVKVECKRCGEVVAVVDARRPYGEAVKGTWGTLCHEVEGDLGIHLNSEYWTRTEAVEAVMSAHRPGCALTLEEAMLIHTYSAARDAYLAWEQIIYPSEAERQKRADALARLGDAERALKSYRHNIS